MKKIYLAILSLISCSLVAHADEGDTTVVVSHHERQLPWYNNYDTTVTFPDGSLSYRKVMMEFELGKYMCEGYDPSNPGEDSLQTGWCGDWDYDVHVIACTPTGDTLELGEFITPYANSNFPLFPWDWKHSYFFDVTDFYPVLKDDVTIRIFYSGYSGGFTGTVKFHFIEGTPARNVVGYSKLWHGGFPYGVTSNPIDDNITVQTETMPADAVSASMRLLISGHGGDTVENCAEFCSKWYRFMVDGEMVNEHNIWRDDCGSNFMSPQSGTWIYNRANWCPGNMVEPIIENVPGTITAGSEFDVDLDFQNYTTGSTNPASYKLSGTMFYYGAFNHEVDAALEEIVSPSNKIDYSKLNPICGSPVVKVKNYGSDTITSIKFQYGIEGSELSEYTYTTSMASLQDAEVTLPLMDALNTITGTDNSFVVKIAEVNGAADDEPFNDELKSSFAGAPVWEGGNLRVHFRMSGAVPGGVNRTDWKIIDVATGATVFSRNGTSSNAQYHDTVHLEDGCYKLEVENMRGYGLSFFGSFSAGFIRMYDMATGSRLPIPDTDLGSAGLEGNFGNGFVHYFRVENSVTSNDDIKASSYSLDVYPNPVSNILSVDVVGTLKTQAEIQLVNILGQIVYSETTSKQQIKINTEHLPSGIYSLVYNSGNQRKIEKVVIEH